MFQMEGDQREMMTKYMYSKLAPLLLKKKKKKIRISVKLDRSEDWVAVIIHYC